MSFAAHKIVDGLLGLSKKYKLLDVLGVKPEQLKYAAADIIKAEKFDFGTLFLEKMEDENKASVWLCPRLTTDEEGFWHDGLIPLPAPLCWFEYALGTARTGLLVNTVGNKWRAARLDITKDDVIVFDGMAVQAQQLGNMRGIADNEQLSVELLGNLEFYNTVSSKTWQEANVGAIMPMVKYLTLMLNSRTTENLQATVSTALNKKRQKNGLTPLPDHRVVRIVPRRFQYERHADGTLSERRSPRLHWRRSHKRTYADGKSIVIARMLVGHAENGHVSHEYKIEMEPK